MDVTSRKRRLIELLVDFPEGMSAGNLASQMDISERTVYRYVAALRRQGESIVTEQGRNGGIRLSRTVLEPPSISNSRSATEPTVGREIPFVGREYELEGIERLLDSAHIGNGGVATLTGEPGIGKTRTAQEAGLRARELGFRVLWGRCLESEGVPAFWPWAQVIRRLETELGRERVVFYMGDGAADILTFLGDNRQVPPDGQPQMPIGYPAPARFRIYESINRFLRKISIDQPLLIVLDDLQWADGPSLAVLEFIASELVTSRMLVLGTYRDDEVTRRHPLYGTLGELTRLVQPVRYQLKGLSKPEVSRYLEQTTRKIPQRGTVSSLHEQTRGNPLFINEIVRLLDDVSIEVQPDGGVKSLFGRVPEGVREVIGRRLDRLSETCNEVLALAAVMSRQFRVPVLAKASRLTWSRLSESLNEAERARIIEPVQGHVDEYQFTHPLMRATLYDELSTLTRANLHRDVAVAFEDVDRDRVDQLLPQLGHHFFEAARSGEARKAVDYCRRAAQQFMTQHAPEESVTFTEMALQALKLIDDRSVETECELQIELGEARRDAGELIEALATFRVAADLGVGLRLPQLQARAALGFEETTWRPGWPGTEAVKMLDQALDALPAEDSQLRSRCLASKYRGLVLSGRRDEAVESWRESVSMARRLEEPFTLTFALHARIYDRWWTDVEERISVANEVIEIATQIGDWERAIQAGSYRLVQHIDIGAYRMIDHHLLKQYRELSKKARHPFNEYVLAGWDTVQTISTGSYADAEELAKRALFIGRRLKGQDSIGVYGIQMFNIRRQQGRLGELAPYVQQFVSDSQSNAWRPGLALIYSELGLRDEATAEFEIIAEDDFAKIPKDTLWLGTMSYLAEVCAFLEDEHRAAIMYQALVPFREFNSTIGMPPIALGSVETYLGLLAETSGEIALALEHHGLAVGKNQDMERPPLIARAEFELAKLLLKSSKSDHSTRAKELLDNAHEIATRLGMQTLVKNIADLRKRDAGISQSNVADLTQREVEVLGLIAIGDTNRTISERLFITQNTVANHVKSILNKTGSANRTEAAAFAARSEILADSPYRQADP